MLSLLLEREGFQVSLAKDGEQGEQSILGQAFDAIVLDIMLPYKDGLELLRIARGVCTTPIMMLTAKGEELDRILGFELGADDYLPKPFNPREFLARIKAMLRRTQMDEQTRTEVIDEIRVNNLTIFPKRREVRVDQTSVNLTAAEFRVLMVLTPKSQ